MALSDKCITMSDKYKLRSPEMTQPRLSVRLDERTRQRGRPQGLGTLLSISFSLPDGFVAHQRTSALAPLPRQHDEPIREFTGAPRDPRLYAALSWRNLGPFRAGRVSAVSGAVGQPGVFYAGFPGGGL